MAPVDVVDQPITDDRPVHVAKCLDCEAGLKYRESASGASLIYLERYGVDVETMFGLSASGLPLCPNGHGEMALHDEQIPAADAINQVAEQLDEPQQASLPGIVPAFNFQGAYEEIEAKAVEVEALRRVEEEDHDEYKDSKKAREKAEEILTKMILEFRRRRREKAEPASAEPPSVDARLVKCAYLERNPEESRCPICEDMDAAAHFLGRDLAGRQTVAHVDDVEAFRLRASVEDTDTALDDVGIVIPASVLASWTPEQRTEVQEWAGACVGVEREAWPPRPDVLGTGHVAGEVAEGASVQACTVCGVVLLRLGDADVDDDPYEPGTLVGIDCPGAPAEPEHHYPKKTAKKARNRKG